MSVRPVRPPLDARARSGPSDPLAHVDERDLDAFADALVSLLLSAAANLERSRVATSGDGDDPRTEAAS